MAKPRRTPVAAPKPEPAPVAALAPQPVYTFDETWSRNLERLAAAAGVEPAEYLLRLVKRAWIALPTGMRQGQL